jgi:HEPN domain-containing protein
MSLEAARVAETKSWLVKAASDLRAASHEFTATPPLLDDIAFHAQQAAEKTLKSFLAWHDRPFRKTHDLVELGQACVAMRQPPPSLSLTRCTRRS